MDDTPTLSWWVGLDPDAFYAEAKERAAQRAREQTAFVDFVGEQLREGARELWVEPVTALRLTPRP